MRKLLGAPKRAIARNLSRVESLIAARREVVWLRGELQRVKSHNKQLQRRLDQSQKHLEQSRKLVKKASRQNNRMKNQIGELNSWYRQTARDYMLLLMPKGSVCAEIGVYEGEFSREIYANIRPKKLHLIDPWQMGEGLFGYQAVSAQAEIEARYERVRDQFVDQLESGSVEIHRALSDEAAPNFDDEYFDWVYIDGNHEYEYVKRDLEMYFPKVKPGGYLTGDDYGVVGYWENGIQRAVDEFVAERPECALEVKASQFILKKPAA